jgi:alpha-N-acetylglucosamine transferase
LKNKWKSWWSKVHIFDPKAYDMPESLIFYIDLDMIISGSLDELVNLPVRRFATMSTDEIFCENV